MLHAIINVGWPGKGVGGTLRLPPGGERWAAVRHRSTYRSQVRAAFWCRHRALSDTLHPSMAPVDCGVWTGERRFGFATTRYWYCGSTLALMTASVQRGTRPEATAASGQRLSGGRGRYRAVRWPPLSYASGWRRRCNTRLRARQSNSAPEGFLRCVLGGVPSLAQAIAMRMRLG